MIRVVGNYGVLVGRFADARIERRGRNPHFQLLLLAAGVRFRAAINTASNSGLPGSSDLLFAVMDDFRHPLTRTLIDLPDGFLALPRRPGGMALDYVRGKLVRRNQMQPLPSHQPGAANDLNDLLAARIMPARENEATRFFVFGDRWGPEATNADEIFGYAPGNGVHNIHMNQGGYGRHLSKNGAWQDGALLVHHPDENRWVAVFLAFQSQSWRTDRRGDPYQANQHFAGSERERSPVGFARVTRDEDATGENRWLAVLRNPGLERVDLRGWEFVAPNGQRQTIGGDIAPRSERAITLARGLRLDQPSAVLRLLRPGGEEHTSIRVRGPARQ